MIKLIATDCDETLLSNDKTIHPRNIEAIKKAQQKGIIITTATGRGPYQLFDILEQIDNVTKKIVHSSPIHYKKAIEVSNYCREIGVHFQIYTDKHCYIFANGNEVSGNYDKNVYKFVQNVEDIKNLDKEIIIKVIIKNPNLNYLMSLEEDIARICDWDVAISYSSDTFMEINKKNVNKAKALEILCDHYNIKMENVLTIGDNYNDKEMLEEAGYSAAVQNAHLLLKDIAKYTTLATNDQGAVGEAIEKFVLNQ